MKSDKAYIVAKNKKAYFNYEILTKYEAGIVLLGTEVKSVRNGKVNLKGSYATFRKGELYLIDMHISPYDKASMFNHDPKRERKLLLNKYELLRLSIKVEEKGLTIVPLKLYFNKRGLLKVELGVARGKKLYDKRETIAKKDIERQKERDMWGRRPRNDY